MPFSIRAVDEEEQGRADGCEAGGSRESASGLVTTGGPVNGVSVATLMSHVCFAIDGIWGSCVERLWDLLESEFEVGGEERILESGVY